MRPRQRSAPTPATPASPRASFAETLAVYLKGRVLIVMFLGFSSGLPLALSGSTLLIWMRESGVNLGTIGLFALVLAVILLLWARASLVVFALFYTSDLPTVQGTVLMGAFFIIFLNLIVDIVYAFLDPRVRY